MPAASIIPADWPRWATTQPKVIKPLLGGLTNHSYLISTNNTLLVLRKNSPISKALNLNRDAEGQALNHADKAGLCAPLVYNDPQQQYMVSRYLGENTWSVNSDNVSQLAQLLRRIHQLPSIGTTLNMEDKIDVYWQSIDVDEALFKPLKLLSAAVHAHISNTKTLNSRNVLCHNDLLASNLIISDDAHLYAIDWEYAAMGDPFYELAVIVDGNALNIEQQTILLKNYLSRTVSQDDWRRLQHWKIIYSYVCLLWYGVQYCRAAMNKISLAKEITEQIYRLEKLIAS